MTKESIVVEQAIKAPPEKVWQRISTPEGIARWWRPGDISPVVGHEFTMDMEKWGTIPCRVLEVDPGRKLVYTFGDFELHWEIVEDGDVTILKLEHRGFDLDNPQHRFAFANMAPGWQSVVLPRLAESLEETV